MILKSGSILLSLRLADMLLSVHLMGLVLLFRRQGALWGNLVQLGMSQVLLKYYSSSAESDYRKHLWTRLFFWVAAASLLTSVLLAALAGQFSVWLFPSAPNSVTAAFGVYVAGIALGYVANSSWLAEFRFVESSLVDWLHGSLLLMVCLFLVGDGTATGLLWTLALLTLASAIGSIIHFVRCYGHSLKPPMEWRLSIDEVRFGVTRGVAAYVDMSTLVVGPWLLRDRPADAAHLIAAYTVIRIAQTVVMPVAQVLALRANSGLYAGGRERHRLLTMCIFVFVGAWGGVVGFYFFGVSAVEWWLPNSAQGVNPVLSELMPYMPGICLFYALRTHVDLKFDMPINLITLLLGLVAFSAGILLQRSIELSAVVFASELMFSVFYVHAMLVLSVELLSRRTS